MLWFILIKIKNTEQWKNMLSETVVLTACYSLLILVCSVCDLVLGRQLHTRVPWHTSVYNELNTH